MAGVEKLAVSSMRPDLGCKPPFDIAASEIDPVCHSLLGAQSVFMVKGWSRSVCLATILLCGFESQDFAKASLLGGGCHKLGQKRVCKRLNQVG